MYRRRRQPPDSLPSRSAAGSDGPDFDPEWCLKLLPAFAVMGAGAALLLAVSLTKDDFSYSVFTGIALLFWWAVVSAMGAIGGFIVGSLSCVAAKAIGHAVYKRTETQPQPLRVCLTVAAQVSVLAIVGVIGAVWVGFSGGDRSSFGYRGM